MSDMLSKLYDFTWSERNRFSARDNNLFAFSLSQVTRYYQFLTILIERHKDTSKSYAEIHKKYQDSISPGANDFTREQVQMLEDSGKLLPILHLEIESFYLFAKILLDKVAHFLEFYFGQERKLSFDSHDKLTKNILPYSKAKALIIPSYLIEIVQSLKTDISDHRDYEIAHEKSPRTIRGTSMTWEGEVSIMSTQLYPTTSVKQAQTKPLTGLLGEINIYLDKIMEMILNNQDRTRLDLETRNGAEEN
jgi:hypothetical protein